MVAKVAVPKYLKPRESILVEPGATAGATIGVNVLNPDGTVWVPPGSGQSGGSGGGSGGGSSGGGGQQPSSQYVYWRNVLNIPQNIIDLAALTGGGYAYRDPTTGHWSLRRSGRAAIPFSYGDASPMDVYVPLEASVVVLVRIALAVAFNGTGASLSVGSAGTPDLYLPASEVNVALAAGYESVPDLAIAAGGEIKLFISPGTGASAGSGRVIIDTIPTAES